MDMIPQKELRNQVGKVLRRVESGESLIITVAGRPVAELHPTSPRRWVSGDALASVWRAPLPRGLSEDLELLGGELHDPYAR